MSGTFADLAPQGAQPKKQDGSPSAEFVIGTVEAITDTTILITAEGLPQTEENVYINAELLPGAVWKGKGTLQKVKMEATCSGGYSYSVTTLTTQDAELERSECPLKKGDRVVLLTTDHQTYDLICRTRKMQ